MNDIWTKITLVLQSEGYVNIILVFLVLFFLYFFPAFAASIRFTRNRTQVRIINLFLGRTFVGRVIALAMAYSPDIEESDKQ